MLYSRDTGEISNDLTIGERGEQVLKMDLKRASIKTVNIGTCPQRCNPLALPRGAQTSSLGFLSLALKPKTEATKEARQEVTPGPYCRALYHLSVTHRLLQAIRLEALHRTCTANSPGLVQNRFLLPFVVWTVTASIDAF